MTDGDYYATNQNVQYLYNNANLAASGSTKLDTNGADLALANAFYLINLELGISAKPSDVTILGVLKKISLDLIAQQIKTIENLKLFESSSGDLNAWYSINVQFTNEHKRLLRIIKRKLYTESIRAYNINTGSRVF